MSSIAQRTPESLAQRDLQIWNDGDVDQLDEIYSTDAMFVDAFGKDHEIDSWKAYLLLIRTAFPDLHVRVMESITEGDMVVTRFVIGGTMEGEYRGFKPTGRPFEIHGLISHRIEDGEIVEAWNAVNSLAILEQVGVWE
ncbi:ester cyclase [Haladaptatus sp. ZSTT2]|uniref:ester cyclase n=1 Tax=Haladaptatus sp. ZSTT2 TaxID=3120515 RepID=UPI00300E7C87